MAIIVKQRRAGSLKRHTWPRAVVEQLETIPESPPTLPKATFDSGLTARSSTISPALEQQKPSRASDAKLTQAQMLVFSQHLRESIQERELLSTRIQELENICLNQLKANAALIREVRSWQQNYDILEAELVDVTTENEEAKQYVRALETSNANLRYALNQAQEQRDRAEAKRWRRRIRVVLERCRFLPATVRAYWSRGDTSMNEKEGQDRSPSRRPILRSRAGRCDDLESGRCSRMSSHPQTALLTSSPSRTSDKGDG